MGPRNRLPVSLTRDFTPAPTLADTKVVFVSTTKLTWKGMLTGGPLVWRMMRRLKRQTGFICQKGGLKFPRTSVSISFYDSLEALDEFAHSREHMALVKWSTVPGRVESGFIRIMLAAPTGQAFGSWVTAQDDSLDHRRLLRVVADEAGWPRPTRSRSDSATALPPTSIPAGCPVAAASSEGVHP